jgi:hypothetical protein
VKLKCPIYAWTPSGMVKWNHLQMAYIKKDDAEKLLLEAHAAGKVEGLEQAMKIVKETGGG